MNAVQPQAQLLLTATCRTGLWNLASGVITMVSLSALCIGAICLYSVLDARDRKWVVQKAPKHELDGKTLKSLPELIQAIEEGDTIRARALISPETINQEVEGWKPIHFAIRQGNRWLFNALRNEGAECTPTKGGEQPCEIAARFGHRDFADLLREPANLKLADAIDKRDLSLLRAAIKERANVAENRAIEKIIDSKWVAGFKEILGDIPFPRYDINTPQETYVHYAARKESRSILTELMRDTRARALVNQFNENGETPYSLAIERNIHEAVGQAGDVNAMNPVGETLLEIGFKKDVNVEHYLARGARLPELVDDKESPVIEWILRNSKERNFDQKLQSVLKKNPGMRKHILHQPESIHDSLCHRLLRKCAQLNSGLPEKNHYRKVLKVLIQHGCEFTESAVSVVPAGWTSEYQRDEIEIMVNYFKLRRCWPHGLIDPLNGCIIPFRSHQLTPMHIALWLGDNDFVNELERMGQVSRERDWSVLLLVWSLSIFDEELDRQYVRVGENGRYLNDARFSW